MGNLKNQKKKGMELYEKLERDLTQFELEEEEEIAALMANEHLASESSEDDNIRIHDDQAPNADKNSASNDESSAMRMTAQGLDDDAKMQAIQNKIDNGDYDLDDDIEPAVKSKDDLFFATEIETDYQQVRAENAKSMQLEKQRKQAEGMQKSVLKKMSNNQVVSDQLALVN